MKKILIYLSLILALQLNAQTNVYHPFQTDTSAVWYVQESMNPTAGITTYYFYKYFFKGDTLINNLSYKKLYRQLC